MPSVEEKILEMRNDLSRLALEFPVERMGECSDRYIQIGCAEVAAIITSCSAERPINEIEVNVSQAYLFGIALLAIRYQAVTSSRLSYSSLYAKKCKELELDIFTAKLRRRAMYVPVMAEDDMFIETVSERSYWRPTFRLVQTMEFIKHMVPDHLKIDWIPFGGAP